MRAQEISIREAMMLIRNERIEQCDDTVPFPELGNPTLLHTGAKLLHTPAERYYLLSYAWDSRDINKHLKFLGKEVS